MKRLRDAQKKGKPPATLTFPDEAPDEPTAPELPHPGTFDLQIDPMLLPTQDDFMQPEPEVPPPTAAIACSILDQAFTSIAALQKREDAARDTEEQRVC